MDIATFNKIAALKDFLPTKKLNELTINQVYKVTDLRQVKTKFGLNTVASLEDSCQAFLPKRISTAFEKDEAMFQRMTQTAADGKLFLKYLGGGGAMSNSGNNVANQIEFVVI